MKRLVTMTLLTLSMVGSATAFAWYGREDCEEHGGKWLEDIGYCQMS